MATSTESPMEWVGRILFVIVGLGAILLVVPLLLFAVLGYLLGSAGELDYGLACRSQACVDEAWVTFLAATAMIVGTIATVVLIIRGSRRALIAACLVALGYGLVGIVHTLALGGLLWVPSVTAGLLALGSGMRLEALGAGGDGAGSPPGTR